MVIRSRRHGIGIPLIDLDDDPGIEAVRQACLTAGCFNVTGGGLDPDVTRRTLESMVQFFSLADDDPVKRAVHRVESDGAHGWTPMLEEPAYQAGTVAWVESFDCVLSRHRRDALPPAVRQTIVPMKWPQLNGFHSAVGCQWDMLFSVAQRIFPLVSGLLRQEPGFLASRASSQALNTLRLLNYPQRAGSEDPFSTGISAHTDFECITLISQDAPGLEVRSPGGDWIQVPVEAGQWTVLIGDMVERWSNGSIRATPHRVPTTAWPRRSIVMFLAADAGLKVEPLAAFAQPGLPPAFEPITQEGLIEAAMARAESNRQEMMPQIEKLRSELSRG